MKKPIYERILLEAENDAKVIIAEANAEKARILKSGKETIIAQNTAELNAVQAYNKARVKNFTERQEKGLVTFQEQARQQLVVDIFGEALAKINNLTGKDLLAFIKALIAKEELNGDEVMQVSKRNYKKYAEALSKDGKTLDLLNSANAKYNFTLSKESTHISEGFLLSGKKYDLIFDFKEIVDEYQKKHEQRIYHELFTNE